MSFATFSFPCAELRWSLNKKIPRIKQHSAVRFSHSTHFTSHGRVEIRLSAAGADEQHFGDRIAMRPSLYLRLQISSAESCDPHLPEQDPRDVHWFIRQDWPICWLNQKFSWRETDRTVNLCRCHGHVCAPVLPRRPQLLATVFCHQLTRILGLCVVKRL